jgi:NDP-sugar pyrophosphorylase family protein
MKELCEWLRTMVDEFPDFAYPWEVVDHLRNSELETRFNRREVDGLDNAEVFCGENVDIQPYVLFSGRVIIGDNTRIGPFSFLRGPMIIGKNCLVGPHCEIIRMILQDNVTLAHKNLMGDSIISSGVSCAGMTTICNYTFGRSFLKVRYYETELDYPGDKYGALIGENCKMGALTMIMPGAHIHPNTNIIGQSVVSGKNKIKSMVVPK